MIMNPVSAQLLEKYRHYPITLVVYKAIYQSKSTNRNFGHCSDKFTFSHWWREEGISLRVSWPYMHLSQNPHLGQTTDRNVNVPTLTARYIQVHRILIPPNRHGSTAAFWDFWWFCFSSSYEAVSPHDASQVSLDFFRTRHSRGGYPWATGSKAPSFKMLNVMMPPPEKLQKRSMVDVYWWTTRFTRSPCWKITEPAVP